MSVTLLQGKRRFDHDGRFDIVAYNWNTPRLYASAIGGSILSLLIAHPLDTLKIHAQVGPRLETRRPLVYTYAYLRTYGLRTLYRGFAPVWWSQMAGHSIRLAGTFRSSTTQSPQSLNLAYTAAILGSFVNAFIYQRYDLAVTRMQAESAMPLGYRRFYTSIGDCLRRVRFEEGKYVWMRGLILAWFKYTWTFATYILLLPQLQNYYGGDNYYSTMTSLFGLNFFNTLVLHPIDTAKVYVQTQPMVQPLMPYPKKLAWLTQFLFRMAIELAIRIPRVELKARVYLLLDRFKEAPRPYFYPLKSLKMIGFLRKRGLWYAYNGFWFNFWKTCTATMFPYAFVEKIGKKHTL